jgi:16S rRNA (guanine966-N2)-methyltransferase
MTNFLASLLKRMRIISGRHKGKRLVALPRGSAIRPSSDRTRQAIFDVLTHKHWGQSSGDNPISDAIVLDAFCGSGALGLEALSRGAAHVWFLDCAPVALMVVRRNLDKLKESASTTILCCDVTTPPPSIAAATLIFLDPPYGWNLAMPALNALSERGWLAAACLCVIELGRHDPFTLPAGLCFLDERSCGPNRLVILRRD